MDDQLSFGGERLAASAPLADRMRPRSLDEVAGQPAAAPGGPLRAALDAGHLPSFVLTGPPGTGKTTIARAAADAADAAYEKLNAVTDGIKDLRGVIDRALSRRRDGQRTLLFVDEIARWNRAQQDALLPYVEDGTVILVGATTENVAFEINPALRSRLQVYELGRLDDAALQELLARALSDRSRGLGALDLSAGEDARRALVARADGDARALLGALELAAAGLPAGSEITAEMVQARAGRRIPSFSRRDGHHDMISALIKSVRGSDRDAALYWLARLEAGGEEPRFIARRLVILASEDIGVADRSALVLAQAAFDAVHQIGAPECFITLAHAVCALAAAPKNWDSFRGLQAARELVQSSPSYDVPAGLRAGPSADGSYVHASRDPHGRQEFLPADLRGARIFPGSP